jgi:uncharacterized LabA/DUF88 family protein
MAMRISAYIDGFNLYHAIHNEFNKSKKYLKWLDVKRLALAYTDQKNDQLIGVFFFSAYPHHQKPDTQNTHALYTAALQATGVNYVEGNFKKKYPVCKNCRKQYTTYEEKESDVNLAIYIVKDAYEKISDKIIVITNDSDIAPAIMLARKINPALKVKIITPPLPADKSKLPALALLEAAGQATTHRGQVYRHPTIINENIIARCRLPEILKLGERQIFCPDKYRIR